MGTNSWSMKQKKRIKTSRNTIKLDRFKGVTVKAVAVSIFMAVAISFILFARGYRLDLERKSVSSTGILAISSSPKTAQVFINGEFKGVTDVNLNMPPGKYTVEVKKEGYIPYTKTLTLRGELVEAIDPILFPINPSLSPVTNLGITKAVQVDASDKILVFSETGDTLRDGIYMFATSSRPLNFLPPLKSVLLKSSLPADVILSDSTIHFSNDYKEALIEFNSTSGATYSYLINLDSENKELFDVGATNKDTLTKAWETETNERTLKILEAYPKEIRKIASDSFGMIKYSPDDTKILYRANRNVTLPLVINPPLIASNQTPETRDLQAGHMYVYDMREDKNYHISDGKLNPSIVHWYNDSKRLVYRDESHILVVLYDGTTKQTVYSGPIEKDFISVNSDGKIMILANLNPASNKLPDLYQVGIR